ncbi:MAG: 3-ketoacyl-ACP reductase [Promethearchaeota archaeon]
MKSDNKIALVTGSTHGIGKAIALELARLNYSIVINGASTEKLSGNYISQLKSIFKDNQDKFIYIKADISNRAEREKLIEAIKKKFNRIDVLVNNAGVAPRERKDLLESSEEEFERVMKINLQGPYFLTQSIAKWMIDLKKKFQKEYNPYIINISSISSFTASPNRGEYCVSKAGLTMMTKLYAVRLAELGIPVFEVQPGIIKTPMTEPVREKYDKLFENGLTPISRWGLPEEVARVVATIVEGNLPYSTGEIIHVDGGFHLHRL